MVHGDCFGVLDRLVGDLNQEGARLAPAFVFVDPYGFKVNGSTLKQLMEFPRVELFINVIWRYLDMGISNGPKQRGMAATLDSIFDGGDWRSLVPLDSEARAEEAIELFRKLTAAKWATRVSMLGRNGVTFYFLLHLTNHDAGRDLMKDCIWKVCPEGGFLVRLTDDPRQGVLITPEPDLLPLEKWVLDRLSKGPRRWQDLIEEVRQEVWRDTHLNKVIRSLKNEKRKIGARAYQGTCVPRRNPELFLL